MDPLRDPIDDSMNEHSSQLIRNGRSVLLYSEKSNDVCEFCRKNQTISYLVPGDRFGIQRFGAPEGEEVDGGLAVAVGGGPTD